MRTIKTLIMEHVSTKNGATGIYWVPSIEVWNTITGQLNVTTRLYVTKQAFVAGLDPIETKYFKEKVTDWNSKNIESYAFDYVKSQSFFATATEDTVDIEEG